MNSLPATLIDALVVTAEATGSDLSKAAMAIMLHDLQTYPEEAVLAALTRCRRELHGRLSLAAIIDRIDDGFLGPEEAWALVPKNEFDSAILCDEIMQAIPFDLLPDPIAARMAFLERYRKLLGQARAEGKRPTWTPSWGHDPQGREPALVTAISAGRITHAQALRMLPSMSETLLLECGAILPRLQGPKTPSLPSNH